MPYERYERSSKESSFDEYESDNAFIAWIDLLGVRQLTHEKLKETIDLTLQIAAEASATGVILEDGTMVGTPQAGFQYCIVGDAIVIVGKNQPETPAASNLAFLWRVGVLSKLLFTRGLIHRGAITRGPMIALKSEGNQIITGEGVVRAVYLEGSIKATGLYYDKKCVTFLQERGNQIQKQLIVSKKQVHSLWHWYRSSKFLSGILIDRDGGIEAWRQALENASSHKYILRSKKLLSRIEKVSSHLPKL